MNAINNLNDNSLIFDVILCKSYCYDFTLVVPEITIETKKTYKSQSYDIELVKEIPFDLKLELSEYHDFELVTDFGNYFSEEILTDFGNEILTELGEFIMTEDDVYIIY